MRFAENVLVVKRRNRTEIDATGGGGERKPCARAGGRYSLWFWTVARIAPKPRAGAPRWRKRERDRREKHRRRRRRRRSRASSRVWRPPTTYMANRLRDVMPTCFFCVPLWYDTGTRRRIVVYRGTVWYSDCPQCLRWLMSPGFLTHHAVRG